MLLKYFYNEAQYYSYSLFLFKFTNQINVDSNKTLLLGQKMIIKNHL